MSVLSEGVQEGVRSWSVDSRKLMIAGCCGNGMRNVLTILLMSQHMEVNFTDIGIF